MLWRRSTAPDYRFFCIIICGVLLQASCGTIIVDPAELVSDYSASASWKWQNTDTFVLRGRARLQGENQVFSGPFIFLASRTTGRIRADFCGPDGSPLLSFRGDSTGFMFYYPDRGEAFFTPMGLPLNNGLFSVNAVLSLVRTGFPKIPVPWEMAEAYQGNEEGNVTWSFISQGTGCMEVILEQGELFPVVESGDTRLEVTAASWHDSFNAWPMEWLLSSPSLSVVARLRSFDQCEIEERRWALTVPFPPDTLSEPMGFWEYAAPLPVR